MSKSMLLVPALLVLAAGIHAQTGQELQPLQPATPALAVVSAWHAALLSGNYEAYLKTTSADFIPRQADAYAFAQLRRYVPQAVWTRGEQQLDNGSRVVLVVGCQGPLVFGTLVTILEVDGRPLVRANAGFSRLPRHQALPCQTPTTGPSCELDADCPVGHSCRSKRGGGTECRRRST